MQNSKTIIVKVGTSTLTYDSGYLNLKNMETLVRTLSDLSGQGYRMILVTSGAIAVGTETLGLPERPHALRMKQAAAAVGQCRMMHIYDKLFSEYNRSIAQILLTGDDVEEEDRAMHLKNTFSALLEMGVIDEIIEEPAGGAHEHPKAVFKKLDSAISRHLQLYEDMNGSALSAHRCKKFAAMGKRYLTNLDFEQDL